MQLTKHKVPLVDHGDEHKVLIHPHARPIGLSPVPDEDAVDVVFLEPDVGELPPEQAMERVSLSIMLMEAGSACPGVQFSGLGLARKHTDPERVFLLVVPPIGRPQQEPPPEQPNSRIIMPK